MRVLMINTVDTNRNGITNVIFNLCQAIDKKDLVIDYVSINEPAHVYVQQIEAGGGHLFVLSRRMNRIGAYIGGLRDLIRQGNYDIVHAHGNSATLVLEMLAARKAGCRICIAHSHSTSCRSLMLHKLLNPFFQCCCTHRLACGEEAGKWLFGNRPFKVVNNGVRTERFAFQPDSRQAFREHYGFRKEDLVIGHVGEFNDAKNQEFLVEVLAKLTSINEDFRLLLIGDGPLREKVEEKVAEFGLMERVLFAGVTDRIPEHLSAVDLIVMPSRYEGLPLSLIEAQASGLHCVVSDNITHEVDKTGNLIFLPLDSGATYWAEIIAKMQLSKDRNTLCDEAIKKIKACGYDIYTEAVKLKEYYLQAIRERGK